MKKIIQSMNAEDGIRHAKEGSPDLILMDIQLPGMDGLEATKVLKGSPDTSNIKVVAITSHAMSGYEDKVKAAGCDGYITKPIDTRAIVQQVNSFF
jgi:CheY-like chemotaxis protein